MGGEEGEELCFNLVLVERFQICLRLSEIVLMRVSDVLPRFRTAQPRVCFPEFPCRSSRGLRGGARGVDTAGETPVFYKQRKLGKPRWLTRPSNAI